MPGLFRRGVVVLAMVALLFVPVVAFSDDGQLQPPIGAHGHLQPPIGAPSHSGGFWNLVLIWLEVVV